MAQVTISGLLDFANANVSGTMPYQNGNTFSTTQGTAATSVIRIEAVEELDGGMKATVHYGLDPRTLANDALGNSLNISGAPTANTTTGLSRDQVFVGLAGSFGEIKLGSANSIGLTSYLASSVLGTGVGSGFGPGSAGTGALTYSNIRYNRSVRYDSPNMNGFSFAFLHAPGNDETLPNAAPAGTALWIPNARTTTEIGLSYANGPLTLSAVNIKQDAMDNKAGWYTASGIANTGAATSNTSFNAKYVLGNTTFVAGMNDGDALAVNAGVAAGANPAVPSTPKATKGSRIGVSHAMGNVVLAAQLSDQKTANVKSKVTGLRADYNFSKSTTAYVGYENWDSGVAAAAGTAGTGERKITSIGLRKSF